MDERINLGAGHSFSKILDEKGVWVGIMEYHTAKRGHRECIAFIGFQPYYWEPGWKKRKGIHKLTLSPSVRCDCGVHGWITKGRWRKAYDRPTFWFSMRRLFGREYERESYGVWPWY